MAFKVKKPEPDGRAWTYEVKILDGFMTVIRDEEKASLLKDFGYIVSKTTMKPGMYPDRDYDRKE